ncbi:hypothetical protein SBOR_0182 [Sclerotinia borealis F-4128]|uniref:Ketopantoate reductase C-terminal domain-containing protein n=1 Tax=Sclerotinia borealis (strain F-4128) TaxID=1432307 RepID=W9CXS5_SCLBF|nr:hypothetical protein SBOR_0182 [Sclerotinia borealis F-4128]
MFLPSKSLWRAGPLSVVHVRQPRTLLYQQFQQLQQQSRGKSTIQRGKRIHIVGAINLQTLIANALAQSANTKKNPITLMMSDNSHLQHYVDHKGELKIISDGVAITMIGAVDIEVLPFPMESSVPDSTYHPTKILKFQRLLLNTGPDGDDSSVDDLPSLPGNGLILGAKKEPIKMVRLPISDIKVYDLSYFVELNTALCGPVVANMDVVTEVREDIREAPRESDIKAVPVDYLDKINTEPIDHLIYVERSRNLIDFFRNIRHRLHPASSVMIIGNNPGMVEDLYDQVFTNVSTRPNFFECTNGMFMGETSLDGFWDSPRSVGLLRAQLSVGPLTRTDDDGQTPGQVAKREKEIKYLVKRVVDASTLNAVEISRDILERYKLKKLVARSVIYPLTVAFNCMMGEIISTEERVADARLLFEEACSVVKRIDQTLNHQILVENLLWQIVRSPNTHPIMWKCVQLGWDTNIDVDNGWIIKYGKGETPTHVKYAKIVKDMASKSAMAIAAEREETAKANARFKAAQEKAASRHEAIEKRLEYLDTRDIIGPAFKRLSLGTKVEAPLFDPASTYYKSRHPTVASSHWETSEASRNNGLRENEGNPSSHIKRSGNDDVKKASELVVDEKKSGGGADEAQA